ncbi:MAG: GAF domain-containing sensor histidine kinase [Acidobacteriota bacterium]
MQTVEISPELADAADVLSDRLQVHLQRMARLLEPDTERIERRFLHRLRQMGFHPKQRTALAAITSGAAARILGGRGGRKKQPVTFIEQVEYSGRRLAKLNLPPSAILEALQEYDRMLAPLMEGLPSEEHSNFRWVQEQLHFCVVLTLNNAYYQVREAETQAFYELFRIELESRNLDELLQRFLESLMHACGANAGRLYMLNDDASVWVLKAGAPDPRVLSVANRPGLLKKLSKPRYLAAESTAKGTLLDPEWHTRYQSCWSIPFAAEGRTAGVMQFGFEDAYEWLPREQDLLAAAAERCLLAAEKARLMEDLARREEQVRGLAEHMLHVEEVERRRISRELHDEAGQSLLCIRLQLELIEQSLPESEGETRQKLAEARDLTERTILEMRRLISALSPAVLEQLGLGAALRQLVNRFQRLHLQTRVKLQLAKMGSLPQQLETICYRLVQECFNNIGKHAAAKLVTVSIVSADGVLKLVVEDNGTGFKVEEALLKRESFGLAGMRERVALLGGQFHVESRTEGTKRGTKISIELPIAK